MLIEVGIGLFFGFLSLFGICSFKIAGWEDKDKS